jgi:hypothetical protein
VTDPAAVVPAYARLFGNSALAAGSDWLHVAVGRQRLRLVTPERLEADYPGMVLTGAESGMRAMIVRCRDVTAARRHLEAQGIPLHRVSETRLVVPPVAATGVVLEFTEVSAA